MKILLLNQFFWPDSAATSQLLTDLARELVRQRHDVIAVCGSSRYAGDGGEGEQFDVEIRRFPTLPFARSTAGRILSYASFLATACWVGLFSKKPDVVLTLTTPPLLSLVGTFMKLFRGTRHWIWEMDVYPDVAVNLGYLRKGSLPERAIGTLADFSRRRADGVITLGECMRELLAGRGIPGHLLQVADNWSDGRRIEPVPFPNGQSLRILYSGNLGLAHDVDTVREAIRVLDSEGVTHFDFAGGGGRRKEFEEWCAGNGIRHVEFRSYRKWEQLGASLGSGDIGLVTQKPECAGTVVPSKVYGLMAAGRPVLYIGPRGTQPALIIEKHRCGWQIDCGDTAGLVDLLRTLHTDRKAVQEAGMRARQAFLEHYDLPHGVHRIIDLILTVEAPVAEPLPAPLGTFAAAVGGGAELRTAGVQKSLDTAR